MDLHRMRAAALVAAALTAVSLSACPVPPAPHPEPEPSATCDDVCARWTALGCKEAEPTPGGIECIESCERLSTSGIFEWDLDCRATVSACDEIDACEQ